MATSDQKEGFSNDLYSDLTEIFRKNFQFLADVDCGRQFWAEQSNQNDKSRSEVENYKKFPLTKSESNGIIVSKCFAFAVWIQKRKLHHFKVGSLLHGSKHNKFFFL